MKYNPNIHHRRSIRLRNYDYSQAGAYFVTICVQGKECLLGNIENGSIELNDFGEIVDRFWHQIPNHFANVEIDAAVIMPNHFHGIIIIDNLRENLVSSPTLGQIVAYFKYQTAKFINLTGNTPGVKIWQRNYYEHIIRDDRSLDCLREYIANNPRKWEIDRLHPNNRFFNSNCHIKSG